MVCITDAGVITMKIRTMNNKIKVTSLVISLLVLGLLFTDISIASNKGMIPDEVVKQILQHPKLTAFFHPEVEGRLPIVIQSFFVNPNIKLLLYDKPVVVVPDSKKQITTNIYMSFFENGHVSITYPVEGIKGTFQFALVQKTWVLKDAKIWEE